MIIRSETLKSLAAERGATPEQLGETIARDGLDAKRAASAVRNWMRGSNHPRARVEDVKGLASFFGVEVSDLARFTSVFKFHRGSPRKTKLITDMIRGKTVEKATQMLTFTTKRAAVDVKKALDAAVADAQFFEADESALVVADSRVDSGPVLKRFHQKDRGRAHPIHKKMSHITIGVEEK